MFTYLNTAYIGAYLKYAFVVDYTCNLSDM